MDEALLTDARVLVTIIAVLFGMLQGSLLYIGKGVFKRLDGLDGSLKEHEKRIVKNENRLQKHEILFNEHMRSSLRLTTSVDRLAERVDKINVRCIATRHESRSTDE